jgi:hypothetical protein
MLFWTVIPEHATRHSFPLFPGLAGLAAFVWIAWLRERRFPNLQPANKKNTRSRVAQLFIGLVVSWLVVKLVFVQAVLPRRNPARQPKEKGQQLAAWVPNGNTLYLFQVKDEGIMFYYRRPVRRLPNPEQLPSSDKTIYCILDETEWRNWSTTRPAEMLLLIPDEQGDPMVLMRVNR